MADPYFFTKDHILNKMSTDTTVHSRLDCGNAKGVAVLVWES